MFERVERVLYGMVDDVLHLQRKRKPCKFNCSQSKGEKIIELWIPKTFHWKMLLGVAALIRNMGLNKSERRCNTYNHAQFSHPAQPLYHVTEFPKWRHKWNSNNCPVLVQHWTNFAKPSQNNCLLEIATRKLLYNQAVVKDPFGAVFYHITFYVRMRQSSTESRLHFRRPIESGLRSSLPNSDW